VISRLLLPNHHIGPHTLGRSPSSRPPPESGPMKKLKASDGGVAPSGIRRIERNSAPHPAEWHAGCSTAPSPRSVAKPGETNRRHANVLRRRASQSCSYVDEFGVGRSEEGPCDAPRAVTTSAPQSGPRAERGPDRVAVVARPGPPAPPSSVSPDRPGDAPARPALPLERGPLRALPTLAAMRGDPFSQATYSMTTFFADDGVQRPHSVSQRERRAIEAIAPTSGRRAESSRRAWSPRRPIDPRPARDYRHHTFA
jgi:hypothetical protein